MFSAGFPWRWKLLLKLLAEARKPGAERVAVVFLSTHYTHRDVITVIIKCLINQQPPACEQHFLFRGAAPTAASPQKWRDVITVCIKTIWWFVFVVFLEACTNSKTSIWSLTTLVQTELSIMVLFSINPASCNWSCIEFHFNFNTRHIKVKLFSPQLLEMLRYDQNIKKKN